MDFALMGFGVSNRSVLKFILEKKLGKVFVSENGKIGEEDIKFFTDNDVDFEENGNTKKLLDSDLIIYSPSVRPDSPLIGDAVKKDRAIGEIEFAWRYVLKGSKVIAITGSNGKTTTVSLIDHVLKEAGINHFTGGNIGTAASDRRDEKVSVLEISSFQLMGTKTFDPEVGAILNISPNHLDWHKDMDEYVNAKMKLSEAKVFLYNADSSYIPSNKGLRVSRSDGSIKIKDGEFEMYGDTFSLRDSKLFGIHNVYNAAFASVISKFIGASNEDIQKALKTFKPLEHRQELFARIDGVTYINDSKSTTSESTLMALDNFKGSIVIICGRPKEKDYSDLVDGLKRKAKSVIIMGDIVPKVKPLMKDLVYFEVTSMEDAVLKAKSIARDGDVVLLSPGATSFDMFKNYEERGETFKRIVMK
uniref:UDP-N-acetylmuramoylalanine--D-glutamate ligase n=1 Tax=Mesoaciditoga lauensis TaxID=1495039 RepID=A0A7V3VS01_9BACT